MAGEAVGESLVKIGTLAEKTSSGIDKVTSTTGKVWEGIKGLDIIFVRFVDDIYGPMMLLTEGFCFFMGITLAAVALMRLAKQGPQGPKPIGTFMTLVVATVLFSAGMMVDSFSETLFCSPPGDFDTVLIYKLKSGDSDLQQRANVAIESAVKFVQLVGLIAFIRGWFVLKAVSDGTTQSTMMAGFTHIVGGILAINIVPLVITFQNTLGGGSGKGFQIFEGSVCGSSISFLEDPGPILLPLHSLTSLVT
ncbi:MAG: hypothetical protein U9N14_07250 [Pseudomonadota bacterium]|nr:hypothetical protein [Pseudomonadota bacterium]